MTTAAPAFVRLQNGGLLLDCCSGALFQLNPTAAFVWERKLAGIGGRAIAEGLALTFGVPISQAEIDVDTAGQLPSAAALPRPTGDFSYERVGDLYRYSYRDKPVLELSPDLALRKVDSLSYSELSAFLKTISPKVFALGGATVLHASAVLERGGSVLAFSGVGGAGKTTTARALSAAGLRIVSEDKLMVRIDEEGMARVPIDGERHIERWVLGATDALFTAPVDRWVSTGAIEHTGGGPCAALDTLLLLDAAQRAGSHLGLTRLHQTEAAAEVFRNVFFGSDSEVSWKRLLDVAATMSRTTAIFRATMPDGLDRLAAAALRYTEATSS